MTWRSESEFIDATQRTKHSCQILHEVCDNSNNKQPNTKNQPKTRVSAGNISTLTGRRNGKTKVTRKPGIFIGDEDTKPGFFNCHSILPDRCDKSNEKRRNGDTQYQSNADESHGIGNVTTLAGCCSTEIKVIPKPEIVNFDAAANQYANGSG